MKTIQIPAVNSAIGQLIEALSAVEAEKFNSKPAQGGWSAAQIGDHLLQSYGTEILQGPAQATDRDPAMKEGAIKSIFLNFDIKMESPSFIVPRDEPIDKNELINALKQANREVEKIIESTELSEECLAFELPDMGPFTRLEWLYLMYYHTQRHIRQVKALS